MNHFTLPRFWKHYRTLPADVHNIADQQFERLKLDPQHPSLHFKKVGSRKQLWSARVGMHYRVLALINRKAWSGCGSGRTQNITSCSLNHENRLD